MHFKYLLDAFVDCNVSFAVCAFIPLCCLVVQHLTAVYVCCCVPLRPHPYNKTCGEGVGVNGLHVCVCVCYILVCTLCWFEEFVTKLCVCEDNLCHARVREPWPGFSFQSWYATVGMRSGRWGGFNIQSYLSYSTWSGSLPAPLKQPSMWKAVVLWLDFLN